MTQPVLNPGQNSLVLDHCYARSRMFEEGTAFYQSWTKTNTYPNNYETTGILDKSWTKIHISPGPLLSLVQDKFVLNPGQSHFSLGLLLCL